MTELEKELLWALKEAVERMDTMELLNSDERAIEAMKKVIKKAEGDQ